MTKYEELQQALKDEGKRLLTEFYDKAEDGDLARLGRKLGVLIKDKYTTNPTIRFCPVMLGGMDTQNIYDIDTDVVISMNELPEIELIWEREDKAIAFQNFIKEKIKESEDIPF